MANRHCANHDRFRANEDLRLATCSFHALDDQGGVILLELWNCPCDGTFTVPGIGPLKEEA